MIRTYAPYKGRRFYTAYNEDHLEKEPIMDLTLKIVKTTGWLVCSIFAGLALKNCWEAMEDIWS